MYHNNRNITVLKFGHPHMVQPVLRSENWNFPLNSEGRISGTQCSDSNMAASAHLGANSMNFVQESAEKDEIKPKTYVPLGDYDKPVFEIASIRLSLSFCYHDNREYW